MSPFLIHFLSSFSNRRGNLQILTKYLIYFAINDELLLFFQPNNFFILGEVGGGDCPARRRVGCDISEDPFVLHPFTLSTKSQMPFVTPPENLEP